ncbi:hypothetical protein RS022_09160 [Candidatus Phytoplasma rubi]|uniref:Uncharacterized protein n=1 Tax=Candidatus Phytoplasma rubi TaxID=399025 RepID=A0ABY7BVB8_9MOLU|nr:hypothetical protein RS022_09160 [Candidatus Phytoplasma rubi]
MKLGSFKSISKSIYFNFSIIFFINGDFLPHLIVNFLSSGSNFSNSFLAEVYHVYDNLY